MANPKPQLKPCKMGSLKPVYFGFLAGIVLLSLFLLGCGNMLAGGSAGTDNPTVADANTDTLQTGTENQDDWSDSGDFYNPSNPPAMSSSGYSSSSVVAGAPWRMLRLTSTLDYSGSCVLQVWDAAASSLNDSPLYEGEVPVGEASAPPGIDSLAGRDVTWYVDCGLEFAFVPAETAQSDGLPPSESSIVELNLVSGASHIIAAGDTLELQNTQYENQLFAGVVPPSWNQGEPAVSSGQVAWVAFVGTPLVLSTNAAGELPAEFPGLPPGSYLVEYYDEEYQHLGTETLQLK